MTQVAKLIPPTDGDAKAAIYGANLANGWDIVRGPSDHEMGWVMAAPDDAPPIIHPAGPTIRPTRPSGWAPFWVRLLAAVAAAALVGVLAR